MFSQIYCLVRLDQRLFQHFDRKTEKIIAQAGEGSWGYTEASYGRTILYDQAGQERSEAYLQGSLTFIDTILSNIVPFLEKIENSEGIIAKIKQNVLQTLNNRQQLILDIHGEIAYFGKCNLISSDSLGGFKKVIIPSIRHTAGGLSALLKIGKEYEKRATDAFFWLIIKTGEAKEAEIFDIAVDYSCIIRAYNLYNKIFPDKNVDKIISEHNPENRVELMKSYLETDALKGKELYGKDVNDPLRIFYSLWILDNVPSLKKDIKKKIISSIVSLERKGGIPFWLSSWPRGRKELDRLIPSNLSYEPDFGLTASLVNILCGDSTISDCGEAFCKKYSQKYFDWLLENYRKEEYFYGTNSRQWSYLLSLPLCEKIISYFNESLSEIEEIIIELQEELSKNKKIRVKSLKNKTFRNVFRIRILNERLFEHGKLHSVFPRLKVDSKYIFICCAIFTVLLVIFLRYLNLLQSLILSILISMITSVMANLIYDKLKSIFLMYR